MRKIAYAARFPVKATQHRMSKKTQEKPTFSSTGVSLMGVAKSLVVSNVLVPAALEAFTSHLSQIHKFKPAKWDGTTQFSTWRVVQHLHQKAWRKKLPGQESVAATKPAKRLRSKTTPATPEEIEISPRLEEAEKQKAPAGYLWSWWIHLHFQ